MKMKAVIAALLIALPAARAEDPSAAAEAPRVASVPAEVRAQFKLSPFYEKYVDLDGLPIVASAKVNDAALLEARYLITQMIGHRPELIAAIAHNNVRVAILATSEFTTDIPEHSDLRPRTYWDKRARGLGATARRPAISGGEENLLGERGDPYAAESIFVHEFAHVVHERGLNTVDKTFDTRLRAAYDAAKAEGLWKGTYAATNRMEYWAEATQSWFDTNRRNDSEHNDVSTRAELKKYDPRIAALCQEVYGDGEWRYVRPEKRHPPSPHLAGFDRDQAPAFSWQPLSEQQKAGLRSEDPPPAK